MSPSPHSHRLQLPEWASALGRLALFCLAFCFFSAAADAQAGDRDDQAKAALFLDEDQQYELIAEGNGWQEFRAVDPNLRAVPNATLVAVWPRGIDTAPLPASIKAELYDDFGIQAGGKRFSGERPLSNDVIVVDRAVAEAIANGDSLDPWNGYVDDSGTRGLFDSCGWETRTKNWDWQFDEWTENRTFNLSGNLTGNLNFDIPMNGHAYLDLTYSYDTVGPFQPLCVPYKFRFDQARVYGNVDILGSSDLTAGFSVQGQWDDEYEVFNAELGSSTFLVGPIPVRLEYRLPFYVGYDISAELSGNVTVDTSFGVSGTFDYTCTRDTCTGSSNFDRGPENDQITGGIELDVRAQVNARAMFRVALYDESFLFAEAGAKGLLDGHLWGYYGNGCGDGNGDGYNETVEALVAEADAGYDWVYGYGGFLGDRLWTSTGQRWFLGYWDLLGTGGSTALGAMIHGPSTVAPGETASYTVQLRPCYPFDEPAWFGMAPGTWNGELDWISKGETKTVSRTFTSTGPVNLRARVNHDQKGRQIGIDQWRTIQVQTPEPDAALVLSYIPNGGGARRTFRSDEPGQPPTQFFHFDESAGGFWERPGAPCANGSNNQTYLKVAYDGPTIRRCSYTRNTDTNPTECSQEMLDQFNSGQFFVLNTDAYYMSPSTCQLQQPLFPVCPPNTYCWGRVEFELLDGTTFERMIAYRRYN